MRYLLLVLGHLFTSVSTSLGARLVDFQVAQPPPVPQDAAQCTIQVLRRDFAFSFGMSEVVQFTPPTDCGPVGSWSAITLNFTVTSNGTQFDRLGIFTFQNVEIWRTSTPEPTRGDGIIWTYIKDVTRYTPLFAKPGTFILQLDNLIQEGLDGVYSTVLHATFYGSSSTAPVAKQADAIFPLSTLANDTGNDASVPPGFSLNLTLPQNAIEVYAELYASGNGEEEFWYSNAPNEFLGDLPDGVTLGQGPFREVRLLIDGMVAGVVFPYAVLFTGAISPAAWRPITAYGAIDLPTYFLDLTPFVPLLTDGQPHNFTIDVSSAEDNHAILQNWFVSGVLQVLVDSSSERTTGNITFYSAELFAESHAVADFEGDDAVITVIANRQIHIEADIVSGSGVATHVVWSQDLEYENVQSYLANASIQNIQQISSGTVRSAHNDNPVVTDVFSYPLVLNLTNNVFLVDHSYDRELLPAPFILGSTIHSHQVAGTTSAGSTNNNTFSYSDTDGNTYGRQVNASRNVITVNVESGNLAPAPSLLTPPASQEVVTDNSFAPARLPGGRRALNST
ncbi:peptide-n4-(n-acetyl-beta-glucosaminyl)asparagine amidase a [Moniliophthora roreri MCA 2997]|uniref:Peptide-n4-(N-acetyl-beta-glucosaminyl)asparagine amidase a n=2 Tax=Moniliophthora roreri TaxID=221103 RepID=V2XCQ4_MONRO|nr:peptide-n4-(n-acetyl-beta-glucosaminyl)asparagine amidase a [Moniliophthora roreri MCA 2997]